MFVSILFIFPNPWNHYSRQFYPHDVHQRLLTVIYLSIKSHAICSGPNKFKIPRMPPAHVSFRILISHKLHTTRHTFARDSKCRQRSVSDNDTGEFLHTNVPVSLNYSRGKGMLLCQQNRLTASHNRSESSSRLDSDIDRTTKQRYRNNISSRLALLANTSSPRLVARLAYMNAW